MSQKVDECKPLPHAVFVSAAAEVGEVAAAAGLSMSRGGLLLLLRPVSVGRGDEYMPSGAFT